MIDITKFNLKKLMIIPIGILVLSLVIVSYSVMNNTVPMSIDFKGGTLITVYDVPKDVDLKKALEDNYGLEVHITTLRDFTGSVIGESIEIAKFLTGDEKKDITDFLISKGIAEDKISVQSLSPSVSGLFIKTSIYAVIGAFIFMAIAVFLRFKTFVPSGAVILSAFSDIVTTVAVMIILSINLSLGSFVALLLLIGYSVDTDILLTTRLLVKKEKKLEERIKSAMKTGLTMTGTTLSAMIVLYLVSTAPLLKEIAFVIIIGLIVDLINTWIQNVGILQWYIEKGGRRK
jgi:preprotein translocase subunit SecF